MPPRTYATSTSTNRRTTARTARTSGVGTRDSTRSCYARVGRRRGRPRRIGREPSVRVVVDDLGGRGLVRAGVVDLDVAARRGLARLGHGGRRRVGAEHGDDGRVAAVEAARRDGVAAVLDVADLVHLEEAVVDGAVD